MDKKTKRKFKKLKNRLAKLEETAKMLVMENKDKTERIERLEYINRRAIKRYERNALHCMAGS